MFYIYKIKGLKQKCHDNHLSYLCAEDFVKGFVKDTQLKKNIEQLKKRFANNEKIVIIQEENMSICDRFDADFIKTIKKYVDNILFVVEGENINFPCKYIQHRNFWIDLYNLNIQNNLINHDTAKEKDFLILVGTNDVHRINLVKSMEKNKLLDQSLVSVNSPVYNCVHTLEKAYDWSAFDLKMDRYGQKTRIPFPPQYEQTKFSLVMETVAGSGSYQLSEKTAKPIIAEHPFIIFGVAGYLEYLKSIGFKTFGEYIDESYDKEEDTEKRIQKIIELCKECKDIDYQYFYAETKHIREHNRRVFFNSNLLSIITNTALQKINYFLST